MNVSNAIESGRPSAARSRNMAAIRRSNTTPELLLRRALRDRGLRGYRCDYGSLPGRPDIAFTRYRVAVFVDGGFWHGHPTRFAFGRYGAYWDNKIARNIARDRRADEELEELGWHVVRIWDFQLRRDVRAAVAEVEAALASSGAPVRISGEVPGV